MFRTVVVLWALLLVVPGPRAHAAGKKAPASKTARKSAAPKPSEPKPSDAPVQAAEDPGLDFDLLEPAPAAEAPQAVDPELERAIARRRTMLTLHQGAGIATAVTLAATVVVGQLHFDDRYRGFGDTGRYKGLHLGLATGSTVLFTGTGLLGLLAPTPFQKDFRWDTITFHKIFMSLATVGMLSQLVLGGLTANQEGKLSQVDLARAHQALGYATMGALSAGVVMLAF